MTIKNPMTRELFEAGERFLFKNDSETGALYFEPCTEKLSNTEGSLMHFNEVYEFRKYRCNVKTINNTGFTVYGTHLGKWFNFRIKFETLIHYPAINLQPVEAVTA